MSELAYGVQPRQHAFPVRNRIIAGLAELVVVVEATLKGGARITADRAIDYGRTVMAYPGSRRNPAAAGTNQLLYDGAHRGARPDRRAASQLGFDGPAPRPDQRALPLGDPAAVLAACHGEPATLDQLASRARAVAVARGRGGAGARARRLDGALARPVLAAMTTGTSLAPASGARFVHFLLVGLSEPTTSEQRAHGEHEDHQRQDADLDQPVAERFPLLRRQVLGADRAGRSP